MLTYTQIERIRETIEALQGDMKSDADAGIVALKKVYSQMSDGHGGNEQDRRFVAQALQEICIARRSNALALNKLITVLTLNEDKRAVSAGQEMPDVTI